MEHKEELLKIIDEHPEVIYSLVIVARGMLRAKAMEERMEEEKKQELRELAEQLKRTGKELQEENAKYKKTHKGEKTMTTKEEILAIAIEHPEILDDLKAKMVELLEAQQKAK